MSGGRQRILVIKLGAMGDFVQALGAMRAIRDHHPGDNITLLTTAPYVSLGRASGYFDHIVTDTRPRWTDFKGWSALCARLNRGGYTRVYDLQNSDRSNLYFRLFARKPEWVGTARGASHRNTSPERVAGHAFEGHKQTLALAGIGNVRIDRMDWIQGDAARFGLQGQPYVLLAPGSAPGRPRKRWPAGRYGELARILFGWGFMPVIVGTRAESEAAAAIRAACPEALDLTGQTALTDLVVLGREAAAAVGNDTGPMHLIAPTECPSLVLFSSESDPVRHRPIGSRVDTLQVDDLAALETAAVVSRLRVQDFRQTGDSVVFAARHEH